MPFGKGIALDITVITGADGSINHLEVRRSAFCRMAQVSLRSLSVLRSSRRDASARPTSCRDDVPNTPACVTLRTCRLGSRGADGVLSFLDVIAAAHRRSTRIVCRRLLACEDILGLGVAIAGRAWTLFDHYVVCNVIANPQLSILPSALCARAGVVGAKTQRASSPVRRWPCLFACTSRWRQLRSLNLRPSLQSIATVCAGWHCV